MWSQAARDAAAAAKAASARTKQMIKAQANQPRAKPSDYQSIKTSVGTRAQMLLGNKIVPVAQQFGARSPAALKEIKDRQAQAEAEQKAASSRPAGFGALKDIHDRLKSALNDPNQNNPRKVLSYAVSQLAPIVHPGGQSNGNGGGNGGRQSNGGGNYNGRAPQTRSEQEDMEARQYLANGSNKSTAVAIHSGASGRDNGGKAYGSY